MTYDCVTQFENVNHWTWFFLKQKVDIHRLRVCMFVHTLNVVGSKKTNFMGSLTITNYHHHKLMLLFEQNFQMSIRLALYTTTYTTTYINTIPSWMPTLPKITFEKKKFLAQILLSDTPKSENNLLLYNTCFRHRYLLFPIICVHVVTAL